MTFFHGFRCDGCGKLDPTHPDDGPPKDWYQLARMSRPGCWETEDERHFCSISCLLCNSNWP